MSAEIHQFIIPKLRSHHIRHLPIYPQTSSAFYEPSSLNERHIINRVINKKKYNNTYYNLRVEKMFQSTSSFSGKSESLNSINYYTELKQISKLLQKFESTKLIKSFDVGKPFTFESIDDSHIDYLEGCEFVRADIYKSPLGDSIAQKGIDTLYRTYGK